MGGLAEPTGVTTVVASEGDGDRPTVAVVVPLHNDCDAVEDCLDRLLAQTYPQTRHEIVLVDGNSSDGTRSHVSPSVGEHDHVRLLLDPDGRGYVAARNCGIRNSDAEVLAFLAVDVAVDPTWLADCVAELQRTGADCVGCAIELEPPDEPTIGDRYHEARTGDVKGHLEEGEFLPTSALLVRRSVFDAVGLFDDRLGPTGAREFGNRVAGSGRNLHLATDVTVTSPTRSSVRANVDHEIAIGHDRYRLRRLYPERYGSPLLGLMNPTRYLPPSPGKLVRTVSDWDRLSTGEKLSLHCLDIVAAAGLAYGQFAEAATSAVAEVAPTNLLG